MIGALTSSFASLSCAARSVASSSRHTLSSRPSLFAATRTAPSSLNMGVGSVRHRSQLAPRRTKYRKAHKIRLPFNTGGSLKGTTVKEGMYGLRILAPAKLSAKQLTAAETAIKRKLKVVKGAQIFLRVFPDTPVCVKGNETRMGKGKGSFEYWACKANMGKVIFEIGGPVEIRLEVAKEALRLAAAKLPVPTEFVTTKSAPRLGNKVLDSSEEAALKTAASPSSSSSVVA